jgi:protein SCO1/2
MGTPASAIPAPLREIGFDQHIGQPVPVEATFRDEHGRGVVLGQYLGQRPVVLAFVYYSCPMLCTQVLSGLTNALNTMSLAAGRDFDVVVVSIDPRETPEMAADQKATFLARYRGDGAADGWHFLTGEQASIDRLARAAGFRFAWDEATQQFAHPAGVVVLTPDGRLARYLFGIEYGGRDLRFAIVEASNGPAGIDRRRDPSLLLSLRSDERPVRPDRHACDTHGGRGHRPRARNVRLRHVSP